MLAPLFDLFGEARFAQRRLGLDRLVLEDPRLLDLFFRAELGLSCFLVPGRPVLGDLGPLFGPAHRDLLFLGKTGVVALPVDLQGKLLGFQVLVADLDQGVLLDVVAALLARLDLFGQPRQSLRVEGVGGIEDTDIGLVQAGERDRLHLQSVVGQYVLDQALDLFDVTTPLLLHLVHRHAGGHAAQRIDEAALDQFLEGLGIHGPPTQRLRRRGHRFAVRTNSQKEVSYDLHPHAVFRDERRGAGTPHLQAQGPSCRPG